jgi:hypothetical protein
MVRRAHGLGSPVGSDKRNQRLSDGRTFERERLKERTIAGHER